MSAINAATSHGHAPQDHASNDHAAHHSGGGHHSTGGHGTYRSYMTGFVLSAILTAIPFWLVMSHIITDTRIVALLVMGLGLVQIVVHMIYFLHMNTRSEGGWTMLAMIFTIVLVFITLSGSIWIMYHLNANMMPMAPHAQSPHDMSKMP